jgi:uncharacterized protein YeaO (DUF488 family)
MAWWAMIRLKRIYDTAADDDGCRVLVDRLWPRGVSREDARLDEWCKSVAPSNDLRKWFHEDVDERWEQFRSKYAGELRNLEDEAGLTLLTAAKNRERNHAVVLRSLLEARC